MGKETQISDRVVSALRKIIRQMDIHSRRMALQYGLTSPQLILLQELSHLEEISVGGLAKSVNLSHATVTDILDRLEKRQFIQRTRSSTDKRRVLVRATDSGLALLEKAPPLIQQHFRDEFAKLKEWEQALLLSSVERLADLMQHPVAIPAEQLLGTTPTSPGVEEDELLPPPLEPSPETETSPSNPINRN